MYMNVVILVVLCCTYSWATFAFDDSHAPIYNEKLEETKLILKFRTLSHYERKHVAAVQLERQRLDPNQTHPGMTALQETWKNGVREQSTMRAKLISENKEISASAMLIQSSFYVKKTIFNNHSRLLFVAGIEGSGHHAIKEAMSSCFERGLCKKTPITKDMSHLHDAAHGLAGALDNLFHNDEIENLFGHLRELAYYSQSPDEKNVNPKDPLPFAPPPYPPGHPFNLNYSDGHLPHIYVVGLDTYGLSGMLSYPNGDDTRSRPIDYLDLVPIAALAEAAGIDMRILLLNRRANDALFSTEQRGFGHGLQPPLLVGAANSLLNQMRNLDPQFYLCLDYEDLPSYNDGISLINIGKHLHPLIDEAHLRKMWGRLKPKEHVSAAEKEQEQRLRSAADGTAAAASAAASASAATSSTQKSTPFQPPTPKDFRRSLRDRNRGDVDFLMNRAAYQLWRLNMAMEDTRAMCRIHQRYPSVAHVV